MKEKNQIEFQQFILGFGDFHKAKVKTITGEPDFSGGATIAKKVVDSPRGDSRPTPSDSQTNPLG